MSTSLLDGTGKVALVTGAGGGIGSACVRLLLEAGTTVIAADRRDVAFGDRTVFKLRFEAGNEEEIEAALIRVRERHEAIDYIIHAAGAVGAGRLDQMSSADWQKGIDVNLTSAFLLLKHAYPLVRKPGGAVVLFGSSNGINGGSHLSGAAYACAKAAVINLARYCAKEWAPDGIRVNAISPGPVDTPMLDRLSQAEHARLVAALPLGRYAKAEEVAATAVFLCSDHAASMTGTNTNISSGSVLD